MVANHHSTDLQNTEDMMKMQEEEQLVIHPDQLTLMMS
jgi:hypothetical protein